LQGPLDHSLEIILGQLPRIDVESNIIKPLPDDITVRKRHFQVYKDLFN